MKNKAKSNKHTTSDGYAYLTKRTLLSKARAAGKEAAKTAMELMGYVVVAENGWVIRKYADGRTERIERIAGSQTHDRLVLD